MSTSEKFFKGVFFGFLGALVFVLIWVVVMLPFLLNWTWQEATFYYFVITGGLIGLYAYWDID